MIFKNKIKNNRKTGVILSYTLMVFEVLSTLLLTPFIIRTLGQAEYGVYKLVIALSSYLLLLDMGIGNAVIRFASKFRANNDKESGQKLLGVTSIYYFIIGIITIIIGIVFALLFSSFFSKGFSPSEIVLGRKLLLIVIGNTALTLMTSGFSNIIIAYEKFVFSRVSSIIQILFRIVFVLIFLKMGYGSFGIVVSQFALTIVFKTLNVIYVLFILKLRPTFKKIEKPFVKQIISYSSLLLLQMIATQINTSVDSILLGSLIGSSATIIAVYSVGTQIVQYYQTIGSSFNNVLMPSVVRMVEKKATSDEVFQEIVKVGRFLFMILGLILVGFVFFGQKFIIKWAGEDNHDSYYVALMLMVPYLFILTESVGTQVLWAKNEQKELTFIKIGIVLSNICLTIFLIQINPLIGAAAGTFISLFAGDVLLVLFLFKIKLKISILAYLKALFKGIWLSLLLTSIAAFGLSLITTNDWRSIITSIVLTTAFYAFFIYFYGMNQQEKRIIKSIFKMK